MFGTHFEVEIGQEFVTDDILLAYDWINAGFADLIEQKQGVRSKRIPNNVETR